MFIKKFAESNFVESLEFNLKTIDSKDQLTEAQHLDCAIDFVRLAADLLDEIDMEDEASELTEMLEHLASGEEKSEDEESEEHDESEEDEEEIVVEEEEEDKEDTHDARSKKKKTSDPATKGLTSKKMVQNLKTKGWVFNTDDTDDSDQCDVQDADDSCAKCGGVSDADDSEEKSACEYCGEPVKGKFLFCSKGCADEANDCGMLYDCMDDWDADDANDASDMNDAKTCKGWKKAPVGSPKQKAFCKRHCGMKKKLTSKKVADDPDSCINQGLRRWKCRCH